jgi:hypothetical protein
VWHQTRDCIGKIQSNYHKQSLSWSKTMPRSMAYKYE